MQRKKELKVGETNATLWSGGPSPEEVGLAASPGLGPGGADRPDREASAPLETLGQVARSRLFLKLPPKRGGGGGQLRGEQLQ